MFPYTDPTGDGAFAGQDALLVYQMLIHPQYVTYARLRGSAFTLLDAFTNAATEEHTVTWHAFPRAANRPFDTIDRERFSLQDEYVEWRVERSGGRIAAITFTTEFAEYYHALAAAGLPALAAVIRQVVPDAAPTAEELFGPRFDPHAATATVRMERFRDQARRNPWNDGTRGILFLTHQNNTLGALFDLVGRCAKPQPELPAGEICEVSGACVPERNSDPAVCQAVQNLALGRRALTLKDPAGVAITRLHGLWALDGRRIDINDPSKNQGLWRVTRGGHRADLEVRPGLTLGGEPITSGAQVATVLEVGATVISAPEEALPTWARTGQESSRRIA